jgi:hypothetical protein
MKLLISLLLAVSLPGAVVLRVAAGGNGGIDAAGNVWAPDTGWLGGYRFAGAVIASQPVPYNAMRSSSPVGAPFSYTFQLASGQYNVTLLMLEPRFDQTAGQRLLTVALNGAPVVTGLDLFAAVGALKPYSVRFPVTVTGLLKIDFSATAGNTLISGIQVDSVDVPPTQIVSSSQCEEGIGATYRTTTLNQPGSQSGNMFTGTYAFQDCENMSGGPQRVTRVRCRSDVAGQLCDVLAPDATGNFSSILAAPIVATPSGTEGSVVPGASYQDGQALEFAITIVYTTPQTASWALVSVVRGSGPAPPSVSAPIATLQECQGSGPGLSCDGLLWATLPLADGSFVQLVGVPMPGFQGAAGTTWAQKH